MVSAEDVLGLVEQPNMPGTVHEHPNWRQRLPAADIFGSGQSNVAALLRARRAT
jgi:4-alpha-glucanotransferase